MNPKTITRTSLACMLLLGLLLPAQGHVPLVQGGDQQGAVLISDALKSWAVYGAIHENGEVDLYQFTMKQGDRLVLSLLVPRGARSIPSLVVMGPGIPTHGEVPPQVQVPPGVAAKVVPGSPGNAPSYEPFSPASFVEVAQVDTPVAAAGTYTVAVYEDGTGPYGLAIGYLEEFSPSEWLLVPVSIPGIRIWEGQPVPLIIGPAALMLAAGILFLASRRGGRRPAGYRAWAGSIGGLLCIGSGATTLLQMALALQGIPVPPEVVVTLVLAIVPILIGIASIRILSREDADGRQARVKILLLAALGLVSWAGFIAGPLLLALSALVPGRNGLHSSSSHPTPRKNQ
jgi:hypothetical protein